MEVLTKELLIEMITDELEDWEVRQLAHREKTRSPIRYNTEPGEELREARQMLEDLLLDEGEGECAPCFRKFLLAMNNISQAGKGDLFEK